MNEMSRGQKSKLADIGCAGPFSAALAIAGGGMTIDVTCFGLDAAGKLSDERYMVFFNQLSCPGDAIRMEASGATTNFKIDTTKLPDSIDKLVFAASIDGDGTMARLGASAMTLGSAAFQFSGSDFQSEKAVIVGEIYRRDGSWRFGAVGQGFSGGLSALLAHFGGQESAPAPAAAPAAPKVSLSKVTLTKAGQKHAVSLVKGPSAPRKLIVKATWVDNGDDDDGNDDLDLRVGILLPNGSMKFVCAPDRSGSFDMAPFVRHLGDVTSASAKEPATETVEVNPEIASKNGGAVALVFSVYSALGNGAVSVASLQPKMRMEYGDQVVECAFDFRNTKAASDPSVYTYVIGTAVIDHDKVVLAPSGQTSRPGTENTPWMTWTKDEVEVTMNGPAVFKGNADASELNAGNSRQYS